jgi:uncharacterized membrane protein YraQ (UPF0718 family)
VCRIAAKQPGRYDAVKAFLITINILFFRSHILDNVPDWALPYVLLAIAVGSSILVYMRRDDIRDYKDLTPGERRSLNNLLVTLLGSFLGVVVMIILGKF